MLYAIGKPLPFREARQLGSGVGVGVGVGLQRHGSLLRVRVTAYLTLLGTPVTNRRHAGAIFFCQPCPKPKPHPTPLPGAAVADQLALPTLPEAWRAARLATQRRQVTHLEVALSFGWGTFARCVECAICRHMGWYCRRLLYSAGTQKTGGKCLGTLRQPDIFLRYIRIQV